MMHDCILKIVKHAQDIYYFVIHSQLRILDLNLIAEIALNDCEASKHAS